jgi:hypothetical protein
LEAGKGKIKMPTGSIVWWGLLSALQHNILMLYFLDWRKLWSHVAEGRKQASQTLHETYLIRALSPFTRSLHSWLTHIFKATPFNTISWAAPKFWKDHIWKDP